MTKFCRDCLHVRRYRLSIDHSADGKHWVCQATQNALPAFNLVTGDSLLTYPTCHEARQDLDGCGPEALWWQAKPSPDWPRAPSKAPVDELSPEDFV
jgi:hypothetical protein